MPRQPGAQLSFVSAHGLRRGNCSRHGHTSTTDLGQAAERAEAPHEVTEVGELFTPSNQLQELLSGLIKSLHSHQLAAFTLRKELGKHHVFHSYPQDTVQGLSRQKQVLC